MAELRTLLQPDQKVTILALSVDPADKSKELKEKIAKDGKGDIPFAILSDPEHKTIDAYGLYDPAYAGKGIDGIPHPAIYILDKDRKVVWSRIEEDYRKRPTVDELRQEIAKLK